MFKFLYLAKLLLLPIFGSSVSVASHLNLKPVPCSSINLEYNVYGFLSSEYHVINDDPMEDMLAAAVIKNGAITEISPVKTLNESKRSAQSKVLNIFIPQTELKFEGVENQFENIIIKNQNSIQKYPVKCSYEKIISGSSQIPLSEIEILMQDGSYIYLMSN